MRRLTFALCAAVSTTIALTQIASAADLGRHPVYTAPPPVIYNWNGFYVGGFVGGAFSEEDVTVNGFSYGLDSSFIGGGTLGYNWQFAGSPWLVGIEGELGYMRLTGSAAVPPGFVSSARIGDWYGVLAGRLGWVAAPDWLLYAKGGAVWTDLHADVIDDFNATSDTTTTGWALGFGAEWMFAPRWSVKAEYLFLGIDDNVVVCGGDECFNHDFHGVHTVKVGLNYHF